MQRGMLLLAGLAAAEGFALPGASRVRGSIGGVTAAPQTHHMMLQKGQPRPQAYTQNPLLGSPVRDANAAPPKLPFFLDIGTKGGIVFYTIIGIIAPFFAYNWLLDTGVDVVTAGNIILVGYVGLLTVGWTFTYVFRVANKGMTYAQQLRDYEDAVIQKRYEELNADEVDALMGEIGRAKPKEAVAPKVPAGSPPPDS